MSKYSLNLRNSFISFSKPSPVPSYVNTIISSIISILIAWGTAWYTVNTQINKQKEAVRESYVPMFAHVACGMADDYFKMSYFMLNKTYFFEDMKDVKWADLGVFNPRMDELESLKQDNFKFLDKFLAVKQDIDSVGYFKNMAIERIEKKVPEGEFNISVLAKNVDIKAQDLLYISGKIFEDYNNEYKTTYKCDAHKRKEY